VVAFPGDVVEFTVEGGKALVFVPGGEQIFNELDGNDFLVGPEGTELQVREDVFSSIRQSNDKSQGALVVKYAVHCENEDGFYFAEGNSAPKIIIPRSP